MEKIEIKTSVPKETAELAEGLAKFIAEVIKQTRSNGGWTVGDDLAPLSVAIMGLLPALNGALLVDDEFKEDPAGCVAALALVVPQIMAALKK